MGRRLLSLALVGLGYGLLEALLVTAVDHRMFLSIRQLSRMGGTALLVGAVTCLVVGVPWLLALGLPPGFRGRAPLWVGMASWPVLSATAWLLTAGRRVAGVPLRWLWVTALGAAAAAGVAGVLWAVDAAQAGRRGRRRVAAGIALGVLVCAVTDSLVLRRLYPAFHWALQGGAMLLLVQLARLLAPALGRATGARLWALPLACLLLAPPVLAGLVSAPGLRFSIEQCAPLTGKVLGLLPAPAQGGVAALPADTAPAREPVATARSRLRLASQDVLLLTVDALRADVLASYGGSEGLTPAMDALAAESVVFERAYTPTPHTSYALASLMTGKYMREVAAMAGDGVDHATLPGILRGYGYRTAAFYPPAIFFVDAARFERFRSTQLGFEYAKVMFASAADRVVQLRGYLAAAPREHPLFVWVHLFEPHEPYAPPAGFRRGDSPRARYDGEVAAADDAIGKLVAAFRAARPGATVIVSADHGEEFREHGGQRHGSTLYDEQVRVPLLWSSPGAAPAGRVAAPVDLVDVASTLLGALGLPADARMRGDDLGALLAAPGGAATAPAIAYAALDGMRMAMDGRYKAICHARGYCQLFDLQADPQERRDLSERAPEPLARLRRELAALAASIPRVEVLALRDAGGFPEALSRARLGDTSAAAELPPLLSSSRAEVRAAAATACGSLRVEAAVPALGRLRVADPDEQVRAAAAIAGLRLGDAGALPAVRALVSAPDGAAVPGASSRAAASLALVRAGDAAGLPGVREVALEAEAPERERLAAIDALAALGDRSAVPALVSLLDDVRLRPALCEALGRIGGPAAADALAEALRGERYPEARAAQVAALAAIGDRRARPLLERFLGTDTSVPGGVGLRLGMRVRPGDCVGDLRGPAPGRVGSWACDPRGCVPGEGAALRLTGRGLRRLWLQPAAGAQVGSGGALRVGGEPLRAHAGASAVGAVVPAGEGPVPIAGDLRIAAYVCVAPRDDIPAPPPEPWQADAGLSARPADAP